MTNRGRNRLLRLLGVALTLGVIALDALDALVPLERWMYDRRASLFNTFTPPPTDDLVHVDIDDNSLEAIGAWPWPRSTMADVIDELRRAGAKAIALDVLFAESQPGQHDARLAESIRNAGNVLVPASFTFDKPADPSPARAAAPSRSWPTWSRAGRPSPPVTPASRSASSSPPAPTRSLDAWPKSGGRAAARPTT